jgi:hypothetical protein
MAVVLETPNVAVSFGPSGIVAGAQLALLLQSPLVGLRFQVALPAKEWAAIKHEERQRPRKNLFILRSQQKPAIISR